MASKINVNPTVIYSSNKNNCFADCEFKTYSNWKYRRKLKCFYLFIKAEIEKRVCNKIHYLIAVETKVTFKQCY
jgi:hypothetical protein